MSTPATAVPSSQVETENSTNVTDTCANVSCKFGFNDNVVFSIGVSLISLQTLFGVSGNCLAAYLAGRYVRKFRPLLYMLVYLTGVNLFGLLLYVPACSILLYHFHYMYPIPKWLNATYENAYTSPLAIGVCIEFIICLSRLTLVVSTRKYNNWFSQGKLAPFIAFSVICVLLFVTLPVNVKIFRAEILDRANNSYAVGVVLSCVARIPTLFFIIIKVTTFVCYFRLMQSIRMVRDSGMRTIRDRQEGTVTAMYAGISLVVCWGPWNILQIIHPEVILAPPVAHHFVVAAAFMTLTLNPYLLTLRVTEFRSAMRKMMNKNLNTQSPDSNTVYQTSYHGFNSEFNEMLPGRVNSVLRRGFKRTGKTELTEGKNNAPCY